MGCAAPASPEGRRQSSGCFRSRSARGGIRSSQRAGAGYKIARRACCLAGLSVETANGGLFLSASVPFTAGAARDQQEGKDGFPFPHIPSPQGTWSHAPRTHGHRLHPSPGKAGQGREEQPRHDLPPGLREQRGRDCFTPCARCFIYAIVSFETCKPHPAGMLMPLFTNK